MAENVFTTRVTKGEPYFTSSPESSPESSDLTPLYGQRTCSVGITPLRHVEQLHRQHTSNTKGKVTAAAAVCFRNSEQYSATNNSADLFAEPSHAASFL